MKFIWAVIFLLGVSAGLMLKTPLEGISTFLSAIAQLLWPLIAVFVLWKYKDDISKIIPRVKKAKILGSEFEIEDMTRGEIIEKRQNEVKDIQKLETIIQEDDQPINPAEPQEKIATQEIERIEDEAIGRTGKALSFPIKRNVKIKNLTFDAFGVNTKGQPYFIEVKYIHQAHNSHGGIKTVAILSKLNYWVAQYISTISEYAERELKAAKSVLLLVVVINTDRDLKRLSTRLKALQEQINKSSPRVVIKFTCLNKDGFKGK